MKSRIRLIGQIIGFVFAVTASSAFSAQELTLLFMASSGQQRTAWVDIVARFSKENPDITVKHSESAQEEYKQSFETRIATEKIDIAFWFAGERLKHLADKKLLVPLDDDFIKKTARTSATKATLDAGLLAGKYYSFPVSYYPWGFFYRKSLFSALGLTPPQTWKDFLKTCEVLKAAKITPTAIGAKAGWPTAAWFDYLDLRINGLAFHQKLLNGDIPFTDPKVRKVFDEWEGLLTKGYFLTESIDTDWDSVLPFLYRKQVGMALMGGFAAAKFPPGEVSGEDVTKDIGFFPFPRFSTQIPVYEEAPLDVLVLPTTGQNRLAAHRFLTFLAQSNELNQYNELVRQISPLSKAPPSSDPFLRTGKSVLDKAAGISFFFDRDAKQKMVKPTFDALKRFLSPPHDSAAAIQSIAEGSRP